MRERDILDFWKWFVEHNDKLHADTYNPTLLRKLDKIISGWDLNWEIGPGELKENALTISAGYNIKLLPLTELIISKAPILNDWEYYTAKQPKENWHLVELMEDNISINASDWLYTLLQYKDGKIEVLIKADNIASYPTATKEQIVDIVLTNLLGEKVFMDKVHYIDVVDDFESNKGITAIQYLPEHLNSIS